MHPERTLQKLEATLAAWRELIAGFDDAAFARLPRRGWSAAHVADHVLGTADVLLNNSDEAADGGGQPGRSSFGAALFTGLGSFPPIRIEVKKPPEGLESLYEPEKLTREETLEGLDELAARMRALAEKVAGAPQDVRRKHWAGGWFNARQWFQLAEMHTRHHLRQLRRLAK